jgi:hypothetical protein
MREKTILDHFTECDNVRAAQHRELDRTVWITVVIIVNSPRIPRLCATMKTALVAF